MFYFIFKRTLKSPVFIVLILVTSIFLINEFQEYFMFFPFDNQDDLLKLANVGGSADFVKRLHRYDDSTQLLKMRQFYKDILKKDKKLNFRERELIKNMIAVQDMDDFYQEYGKLFDYSLQINTVNKHERYYNHLIDLSGEDYRDVNKRINNSLEKHDISYYFSLRYADRLMVIWALGIFVMVTYIYYSLNNKKTRDLVFPKAYRSYTYVFNNIGAQLFSLIFITAVQVFVFAFLFNSHVSEYYNVSMLDYIQVYAVLIVPSLIIFVVLLNFLYYLFDSPVVVFPIYFIVESLSSKTTPELGYTINKTNFIIRYDTLFEPLSRVEYKEIFFNRVIMLSLSLVLVFLIIYIIDRKRLGRFNFKLPKLVKKNG